MATRQTARTDWPRRWSHSATLDDMKSTLEVAAVALLLALAVTFMTIFNNAVIGGGETVVAINAYGELVPELLLLTLVVWPTISVGLYHWHKRYTS